MEGKSDRSGPDGRNSAGKPREGESSSLGAYAGFGLQFALSILVFLYLGQWLDRKLGTAPWFLLVGVFFGAGASFYSMYSKLMAAQAREEAERKARREAEGGPSKPSASPWTEGE